ncbi:hypothetical protein AIOL_000811 [Candidatus Rhodobacter oscarellae]|uniref:Aminoglycoside phosphotransferase domain-containing protein n=1 Tax=Candidatus Rhodobacter oscarellae TaxID=1675527 RepID=A0A0J9ECZ4_9RHOB|nr:hypothetical protein [Candidatus Rhodobacter lobularis]KMW60647.1 hypothetical protein AIOL_000811 [Candidatus Rhodobacter lobularis]
MAAGAPDPEAWGLPPGSGFEPLSKSDPGAVLRGTGRNRGYVFRKTRRSEAALAWLDLLHAPVARAGLILLVPAPTVERARSWQGWTAEPYLSSRPLHPHRLSGLRAALRRMHDLGAGLPQRPGFAAARAVMTRGGGGDIDLSAMPRDVARACRMAWEPIPDQPLGLVHGALTPQSAGVAASGKLVLYDWDAARIDHPLFDAVAVGAADDPMAKRAALAYETARIWSTEPDRARTLAALLLSE